MHSFASGGLPNKLAIYKTGETKMKKYNLFKYTEEDKDQILDRVKHDANYNLPEGLLYAIREGKEIKLGDLIPLGWCNRNRTATEDDATDGKFVTWSLLSDQPGAVYPCFSLKLGEGIPEMSIPEWETALVAVCHSHKGKSIPEWVKQ